MFQKKNDARRIGTVQPCLNRCTNQPCRQKIWRDTLCEVNHTQTPPPLIPAAIHSCKAIIHCDSRNCHAAVRCSWSRTWLIDFLPIAVDDRLVTERVRWGAHAMVAFSLFNSSSDLSTGVTSKPSYRMKKDTYVRRHAPSFEFWTDDEDTCLTRWQYLSSCLCNKPIIIPRRRLFPHK